MQIKENRYNPYKELACAVITSAVKDLKSKNKSHRASAKVFIKSKFLGFWADFLNIHPQKIREKCLHEKEKQDLVEK